MRRNSLWAVGALVLVMVSIIVIAGLFGGLGNAHDVAAIRDLQQWRETHPGATHAAIALTFWGGAVATLPLAAMVSAWLVSRKRARAGLWLIATVASARLAADGLKLAIDRTRPSFALHPVVTHSSSFPSGHAANSMATLLAVALFATPPRWRASALLLAILVSGAIGFTRPLLGVHWPSDVLAGWALGAAVAVVGYRLFTRQEEHQIIGRHRPPLDKR
jgi:undecaprenyl-diphosphatase